MNEFSALEARNDYLQKENGPYIFKMLSVGAAAKWLYVVCKTWCAGRVGTGQTAWRWRRFL